MVVMKLKVEVTFFCVSGVPGVKPERYKEGLEVKHCALSLVGEPIMYPEINSFIRLLHSHNISSFLVTNAQFPEEIRYWHTHTLFVCTAAFRSCSQNIDPASLFWCIVFLKRSLLPCFCRLFYLETEDRSRGSLFGSKHLDKHQGTAKELAIAGHKIAGQLSLIQPLQ